MDNRKLQKYTHKCVSKNGKICGNKSLNFYIDWVIQICSLSIYFLDCLKKKKTRERILYNPPGINPIVSP